MDLNQNPKWWFALILATFFISSNWNHQMLSANDDSKKSSKQTASEPADTKKEAAVFTNRLAKETSPYLLLHKHNPVDWYPWGPEAFEKAKTGKENHLPLNRLQQLLLVPRDGTAGF